MSVMRVFSPFFHSDFWLRSLKTSDKNREESTKKSLSLSRADHTSRASLPNQPIRDPDQPGRPEAPLVGIGDLGDVAFCTMIRSSVTVMHHSTLPSRIFKAWLEDNSSGLDTVFGITVSCKIPYIIEGDAQLQFKRPKNMGTEGDIYALAGSQTPAHVTRREQSNWNGSCYKVVRHALYLWKEMSLKSFGGAIKELQLRLRTPACDTEILCRFQPWVTLTQCDAVYIAGTQVMYVTDAYSLTATWIQSKTTANYAYRPSTKPKSEEGCLRTCKVQQAHD
ncbi:hypothetical protein DFH06DRAFT_1134315 [Mycena polygramma]|nr:hypothetical protein DFH06DRAFT_1148896 [Mycena polygramma]KAJ7652875.1 hypothetical protein DFH06DRAFT_1134315 [Mycena polygramma]